MGVMSSAVRACTWAVLVGVFSTIIGSTASAACPEGSYLTGDGRCASYGGRAGLMSWAQFGNENGAYPLYFDLDLTAGANFASINSPKLVSLDTLAAVQQPPVNTYTSATNAKVGGTVTFNGVPFGQEDANNAVNVLTKAGILVNPGGGKSQDVNFPGGVPKGSGTIKDPPEWTVPALLGVSIPTSWLGWSVTGLRAEFLGGININHRKAEINLTEPGAGAGANPVSASSSWTRADPALEIGLKYYPGTSFAGYPVHMGVSVDLDWTGSHSVFAQSPNFPSQSYTLNIGRQMDTSVLFSLGVSLK